MPRATEQKPSETTWLSILVDKLKKKEFAIGIRILENNMYYTIVSLSNQCVIMKTLLSQIKFEQQKTKLNSPF